MGIGDLFGQLDKRVRSNLFTTSMSFRRGGAAILYTATKKVMINLT